MYWVIKQNLHIHFVTYTTTAVKFMFYLFVQHIILDASQYAQYVFNTIKRNQTGKISFEVKCYYFFKVFFNSLSIKLSQN